MSDSNDEMRSIQKALIEPFDPSEVKWKPQVVKGNRAFVVAYVDARVIQDRLDEVCGVDGWQDECTPLDDGSVLCRLQLRFGDAWVSKCDVGSPSEQPDAGDRLKSAFSDALKRAAVKFGVGRYLYRLPSSWVEYDPQKRQLIQTPRLPEDALPQRLRKPPAKPRVAEGKNHPAPPKPAAPAHALPADGAELKERLVKADARMVEEGRCAAGELMKFVAAEGEKAGHGGDVTRWAGPAIELAVSAVKRFMADARQRDPKAVA